MRLSKIYKKIDFCLKRIERNIPKYVKETTNLIKVEAKNPKNEPKAALSAVWESLLLSNSPTNAPKKRPIKIPPGIGEINPTMSPMDVPIIPYLEPPNILVPTEGMK